MTEVDRCLVMSTGRMRMYQRHFPRLPVCCSVQSIYAAMRFKAVADLDWRQNLRHLPHCLTHSGPTHNSCNKQGHSSQHPCNSEEL